MYPKNESRTPEKMIKDAFETHNIHISDADVSEMAWRDLPQIEAALSLVYGKEVDDPVKVVRHILWEWDYIQSLSTPLDSVGGFVMPF